MGQFSMAVILLADDSDDLRAVYAQVLKARGHTVLEAADGREAVDLAQGQGPELMLLDVWMPGLNGLEVLEALRHAPAMAQTRVAMLSVLGDADTQLESFGAGAIEYLVKGLGLDEFVARIEALLAGSPIDPGCDSA